MSYSVSVPTEVLETRDTTFYLVFFHLVQGFFVTMKSKIEFYNFHGFASFVIIS